MAEEHVFLQEESVYVSNTKVLLHGTTYATANITSVTKRATPPSTGCAVILLVFGILLLLGGVCAFSKREPGAAVVVLLVAAGMIAAAVMWMRSLKSTYHVVLASSSGERQGLSSQDESLVDRVVNAIAAAITHRG